MVDPLFGYRITRRKALAVGSTAIMVPVAGCDDGPTTAGKDNDQEQNEYGAFGDALAAVYRPWEKTAREVTAEMVDAVVRQLDDLAKAAFRGGSIGALKAIIEATQTAFRQLRKAQRAWNVEQFRSDAKAAAAGSDVESDYPEGHGYSNAKPFYPLFTALEEGYNDLARKRTESRRKQLRNAAESVEVVFAVGYRSYIKQHIPDPTSPSSAQNITGKETLSYSLLFLDRAAQWTVDNI